LSNLNNIKHVIP